MPKIVATHKTKEAAQVEAKKLSNQARVFRYTVRKSKFTTRVRGKIVSFWNVVKIRK